MTLSSYDLKTNIREKTDLFLQDASHKNYNLLRQLCLDLKPIEAVLAELNKELETLYRNNLEDSKATLTQQACAKQQSLDAQEEATDSILKQEDQKALFEYLLERDGDKSSKPSLAKKIQEKQQDIQTYLQTIDTGLTHPDNTLIHLRHELRILNDQDKAINAHINDFTQRITQYDQRERARVDRQTARNNPLDLSLLQLTETARSDLNQQINDEYQKFTEKYNALLAEGREMAFVTYLNALEGASVINMSSEGRALCGIIKNIEAHIAAKKSEAGALAHLVSCAPDLENMQRILSDRQLDVISAYQTLGIMAISEPQILRNLRQDLDTANDEFRLKLDYIDYIMFWLAVNVMLLLVLMNGVFVITFSVILCVALNVAITLVCFVCSERRKFYQQTIRDNEEKISKYNQLIDDIENVIPRCTLEVEHLNEKQRFLQATVNTQSQRAKQSLDFAAAIQPVESKPLLRSASVNSFFYHEESDVARKQHSGLRYLSTDCSQPFALFTGYMSQ